jgi:hypothetical protein
MAPSQKQRRADRRTAQRQYVQQQRRRFEIALTAIAVSTHDDAERLRVIARGALEDPRG